MSFFRPTLDLAQAQLRQATIQDLQSISRLLSKGRYHHTHPGCDHLSELLDYAPATVLGVQREVWAALVASKPDRGICWIAYLTLAHGLPMERSLEALFEGFHQQARGLGVRDLYYNASPHSDSWLTSRLLKLGYEHDTDVITYAKYMLDTPGTGNPQVRVRRPDALELGTITSIDQACFEPQWTKDTHTIQAAFDELPFFIIAELGERIVGYAYAASYFQGKQIHLVRIAVLPGCQGQGVGLRLLSELTEYARAMHAHTITLNTQAYNTRAQRLYTWFGFRRTSERHMILHSSV